MTDAFEFLAATVRIASPLLFAALGGILSERAGVFAVGLEGMMLAGIAGGMMLAAVVAIATTRFRADQMVTGLAVNVLALGLTSFMLRGFGARGEAPTIRVTTLPPLPVPWLAALPLACTLAFQSPV